MPSITKGSSVPSDLLPTHPRSSGCLATLAGLPLIHSTSFSPNPQPLIHTHAHTATNDRHYSCGLSYDICRNSREKT